MTIGHGETDNLIRDCTIEGSGEVGIRFRDNRNEFFAGHRNRIANCTVRDTSRDRPGIEIDIHGKTQDIIIRRTKPENTASGKQKAGIRIGENAQRILLQVPGTHRCFKLETKLMKTHFQKIIASALILVFPFSVSAADVFVSPEGNDANSGTLAKPFRTVQKGVDSLGAGDTCYVRAGVYRETVNLTASGLPGQPIRIRAYPGEDVLLDGTDRIRAPLKRGDDGVFTTRTELTFQQLFAGDAMLIEARWPNCSPDRMLTRDGWATAGPESEYQKLRDPELAETGIDWNGATAILNVAHQFWSWSRIVEGYVPGSDTLPYTITMNPFHTEGRKWWHDDYYYLCGKREALDAPGEWHLDADGSLSLIPPAGTGIADLVLRVKQRDYGFVGENLQHVEICGFRFFGCSFQLSGCEDCVVEYCNLLYPSYARGVPNAEEKGKRKPCPGTARGRAKPSFPAYSQLD